MVVFDFDCYKQFVLAWVEAQPRKGYGKFRQIGDQLRTNSANIRFFIIFSDPK